MDRRREGRISIELPGFYRHATGGERSITYGQISAGGCRISGCAPGLAPGDVIAVVLGPLGEVTATVRWVREHCAGVEFDARLDHALVDYLAGYCGKAA